MIKIILNFSGIILLIISMLIGLIILLGSRMQEIGIITSIIFLFVSALCLLTANIQLIKENKKTNNKDGTKNKNLISG